MARERERRQLYLHQNGDVYGSDESDSIYYISMADLCKFVNLFNSRSGKDLFVSIAQKEKGTL